MKIYRLWHTFRLWTIGSAHKRANYAKKHGIYDAVGENVFIMDRKIPLYSKLIRFHNNIGVASNVLFIAHDATHHILNRYAEKDENREFQEVAGCIEIMNNVFIGSNTTILNNVRIGPNAIVAAGSVVNKDVPPNTVVGGVPAKVIGDFHAYLEKRKQPLYPHELAPARQKADVALASYLWNSFAENRTAGSKSSSDT